MPGKIHHMLAISVTANPVRDMSDVYTWSFPEFLPFCRHLYDFSSFKAFTTQGPGLMHLA
ncbi:hypothetical protein LZZ85_13825 [Terrimonas sp. NA20]|uniref:Uncharacterized protein n=1 Tax=Terrimonas ginsenosidimutans TaxID=2908004 RepID=A0ABS9KSS4_9BACT|nr:hypothetical protein [Terrimonas ginsenosidimutans]MCG2615374.1 hypothetical protein [Terrimonas ginsenosidimutans]